MEAWVFFVVTTIGIMGGGDGKFAVTTYGPFSSQKDCLSNQRMINPTRGHEMLYITPCLKIPYRSKA